MNTLHKVGGIAALICAATYLLAIGLVATLLTPMLDDSLTFAQFMAFYTPHQSLVYIWHFSMYLVNGTSLALLALALYQHLKTSAPALALVSACFGLIWTVLVFASGFISLYGYDAFAKLAVTDPNQAAALRLMVSTITNGIDSSDRFLGSLWLLLSSLTALRVRLLARPLNYFGLFIGSVGILSSLAPALTALGLAFGVEILVWWIWLGIVMLRSPQKQTVMAFSELRTTTP